MYDPIATYVLSQEVDRASRERYHQNHDPDSLYQYEIWDSIGASPSLRERLVAFITWFRRRKPEATTSKKKANVHSRECAPQG